MFVALHTASLVDPSLARHETRDVPDALHRAVRSRLVETGLREGADADLEASVLVSIVPSLAQSVLDDTLASERAFEILDYAIARALN